MKASATIGQSTGTILFDTLPIRSALIHLVLPGFLAPAKVAHRLESTLAVTLSCKEPYALQRALSRRQGFSAEGRKVNGCQERSPAL